MNNQRVFPSRRRCVCPVQIGPVAGSWRKKLLWVSVSRDPVVLAKRAYRCCFWVWVADSYREEAYTFRVEPSGIDTPNPPTSVSLVHHLLARFYISLSFGGRLFRGSCSFRFGFVFLTLVSICSYTDAPRKPAITLIGISEELFREVLSSKPASPEAQFEKLHPRWKSQRKKI